MLFFEVEFSDDAGQSHTFRNESGGNREQVAGDRVTVYYDSENPADANTLKGFTVGPAVLAFTALVTGLIAWLTWQAKRQKAEGAADRP